MSASMNTFEDEWKKAYPKVVGALYRKKCPTSLVSDMVGEAMLKSWRYRENFRAESKFSTWVIRIAINCYRDHCKKHRPEEVPYIEDFEQIFAADAEDLDEEMSNNKLIEACRAIVPAHMIDTFEHLMVEGLTYEEAARRQGVPAGTIKSRLNRLRKMFLRQQDALPLPFGQKLL
jgi:RNA polymerase sigma-70 factor (ECF subfamily)